MSGENVSALYLGDWVKRIVPKRCRPLCYIQLARLVNSRQVLIIDRVFGDYET